MLYKEYLPVEKLQEVIYCYWELKTHTSLQEHFIYKVVADGCIDIFFDLNSPEESFVMGLCRKYTEFKLDNNFHYFGIRFLPTMFPQIYGINASSISERFEGLKDVVPETAQFISQHPYSTYSSQDVIQLFDNYFLQKFVQSKMDIDNRLYDAIDIILNSNGTIDIEKELKTGLSPRQLRRLFEFYIGDTPKTFCKIVRFQSVLRSKPSQQSLRKNKLFYDAGYYDQAHFIKEFKNFYGVTPAKVFR